MPTRLTGWSVGDLLEHVTWASLMEANALRSAAGESQVAALSNSTPTLTPGAAAHAAVAALDHAADTFAAAIELSIADDTPITVPAGTVPMAFAAALFAFEAALHASDLAATLGRASSLSPEELAACEIVIGPLLDLTAAKLAVPHTVIDLVGFSERIRLQSSEEGWIRTLGTEDEVPATTTITGTPEELVLFVCGRYSADPGEWAGLTIDGDLDHAAQFKRYFVGP